MKQSTKVLARVSLCLFAVAPILCTRPSASTPFRVDSKLQKLAVVSIDNGQASLQFVNEEDGWLVNGKKLWQTADGGRNWRLIYAGDVHWGISAQIENVHFVNSRVGWMSEAVKGIYKTEDGGRTWIRLGNPFSDGAIYSIEFFKDGKEGWAAGIVNRPPPKEYAAKVPRDDSYAAISHTTDGGTSWQRQVIPNTRAILEVYFTDNHHGWARGWPGLFHFEANTKRWRMAGFNKGGCANRLLVETLSPRRGVDFEPVAIQFLDLNEGWLVFKNGYIAKTADGGRTWCDLLDPRDIWPDPIGSPYFWKIHFIDSITGWAIGYNAVYETRNGGASWQVVANSDFRDLFILDTHHGWAVSNEGVFSIIP